MDKPTGELFSAFLEGELSELEAVRLSSHLASHEADREEFLVLARQARVLEVMFGPPLPLSQLVVREIGAEISGDQFVDGVLSRLSVRKRRPWIWVASAAAALLLMIGIYSWFQDRARPPPNRDGAPELTEGPDPRAREIHIADPTTDVRGKGEAGIHTEKQEQEPAAALVAVEASGERFAKFLKEDRLVEAARLIETAASTPGSADPVEKWREALRVRLIALLDDRRVEIESLCNKRDFDKARRKVDNLLKIVPSEEKSRVEPLSNLVIEAERSYQEGREELEQLELRAFSLLARLDFTAIESLLAEFGVQRPSFAEELASLRGDLERTSRMWHSLLTTLRSARSSRQALTLSFEADPLAGGTVPSGRYQVVSVSPPHMMIQTEGERTKREVRSLLSLSVESLLSLVRIDQDLSPTQAITSLGLMLLVRRGPSHGLPLLLAPELAGQLREANKKRGDRLGKVWKSARLSESEKIVAELRKEKAPAEAWDCVARDAISILRDCPSGDAVVPSFQAVYVSARRESLRQGPLEQLVHTKLIKRSSGQLVTLTYDFSSAEQLEDFIAINPTESRIRWVQEKSLELTGECRFLRGNPFEEVLGIEGKVAQCDAKAPNINAVLWTSPEDHVTPRPGGIRERVPAAQNAGGLITGYVVCGMGYRSSTDHEALSPGDTRSPGKRSSSSSSSVLSPYVNVPAYILLGGARGASPCHMVWGKTVFKGIKPPFRFGIELSEGTLNWSTQGQRIPFKKEAWQSRLRVTLPPRGSVSLFTNGSSVTFDTLKIHGNLQAEWIAEEAERMARDELSQLLLSAR